MRNVLLTFTTGDRYLVDRPEDALRRLSSDDNIVAAYLIEESPVEGEPPTLTKLSVKPQATPVAEIQLHHLMDEDRIVGSTEVRVDTGAGTEV